jgi:hypothetical protein
MGILGFQLIESIAGAAGFILGLTYVLGGLIVNLHLSRYGVTEYQVVRVKYLVVGLIYVVNVLGAYTLALIIGAVLLIAGQVVQQGWLIVALLAGLSLLVLGVKPVAWRTQWAKKFFESWPFWVGMGAIAASFPFLVLIRQSLVRTSDFYSDLLMGEGLVVGLLVVIGQVYFYARYPYTQAVFDPIGTGMPVVVQLAGNEKDMAHLQSIGVPVLKADVTDKVLLLDETDTHYIVGIPDEQAIQAIKVSKSIVQVIRYLGYKL